MNDDLISRQAVEEIIQYHRDCISVIGYWAIIEGLKKLSSVNPQESYDFAKWVATEIFDEMWEYNKDAFAEIACRKLAKLGIVREIGVPVLEYDNPYGLGIVRAKGDEWELVEPQESEGEE